MNLLTGASLLALAKSIYYFLFKSCYFFLKFYKYTDFFYSFTNIFVIRTTDYFQWYCELFYFWLTRIILSLG